MTPRQIALARHALGLENGNGRSHRNSFVAGPDHDDYGEWVLMVRAGMARCRDGKSLPFGGDSLFSLTRAGATAALQPGETLGTEIAA